MKPKRCKAPDCHEWFQPTKSFQSWCCADCALAILRHKERQKQRAETRDMRAKLNQNDRKWWIKQAVKHCNLYIRMRDKDLPCISCGNHKGRYDAGHYRPAGNNSFLRFDERNIHKQCHYDCNIMQSGNLINYRIGLVKKIGAPAVEYLEGPHPTKKWTIDELRAVVDEYKRKIKDLKHAGGIA